jgi:hypothetical protein
MIRELPPVDASKSRGQQLAACHYFEALSDRAFVLCSQIATMRSVIHDIHVLNIDMTYD